MREILFRGKRVDNGEWVYWDIFGRIVCSDGKTFDFVMFENMQYWYVKDVIPLLMPETVGQYTGLQDKNGVKIFERDIVRHNNYAGFVAWNASMAEFGISIKRATNSGLYNNAAIYQPNRYLEVIGNIYGNPELIKGNDND